MSTTLPRDPWDMIAPKDDAVVPAPDADADETSGLFLLSVEEILALFHLAYGDEKQLRRHLAVMAEQPAVRRRRRRSKAKPA